MKIKLLFLILLLLHSNITFSQWSTDPSQNLRVTTIGLCPEMITDGAGGAYILYKDMPMENVHLYLQRLDKYGYRKFPNNGILIADSSRYQQQFFNLISDGHHGVLIGFQDVIFEGEIYHYNSHVQRIDSTGQKLWGENDILIDEGDGFQPYIVSLCRDGTGGGYVFWGRYYDRNRKELWVQRVDKNGHIMWDSSGVMISDQFVSFDSPIPCLTAPDNEGGAICGYIDSTGIKLQRIDRISNLLWNTAVVLASKTWGTIKSNGQGGIVIAGIWRSYYDDDLKSWRYMLRAQQVDSDGNVMWDSEGIVIVDSVDQQTFEPELGIDKKGNSYIVWRDRRTGSFDVYGQKLNSEGVAQWKKGGIVIGDPEYIKSIIRSGIVVHDSSGIIVFWKDNRLPDGTISGQYIDAAGKETWQNDVQISSRANLHDLQVISDGKGGAISCWYEIHPDKGIFAQQVSINGNLGEVISTNVKNRIQKKIPEKLDLFQNYPNPFNANTFIRYQISELAFVDVTVFDITGKEVIKLVNRKQKPGKYQVIWNGKKYRGGDVSSGIYFIQLEVDNTVKVIKSLLIK
ncbi:T9SS type A sorting domain-containing protein [candidate division KSB1 bacterium]|nr:T9SS type A sorting domain-containing protein [candidate division KSB1 bacterium]